MGPGALGQGKQQLHAGMALQPLPDGLGFMAIAIIHDDRQPSILWSRIPRLEFLKQRPKEDVGVAGAEAVPQRSRGQIEGPREIMRGVLFMCN
jgi:hypothetical protein